MKLVVAAGSNLSVGVKTRDRLAIWRRERLPLAGAPGLGGFVEPKIRESKSQNVEFILAWHGSRLPSHG